MMGGNYGFKPLKHGDTLAKRYKISEERGEKSEAKNKENTHHIDSVYPVIPNAINITSKGIR